MKYLFPKKFIGVVLILTLFCLSCKEKPKNTEEKQNPELAKTEEKMKYGGLALYTLRDDMAADAKKTLSEVASIGYKNIEAAGYENGKYYGMEPSDFKAYLDSLDLTPISTHLSSVTLENIDTLIADAKQVGFRYFVVPVPPMGMFKFNPETVELSMEGTAEELAGILMEMGKKCNAAGLQLLYHNHDFELVDDEEGSRILDYLLENCDAEMVNFQMDLYWAKRAGADALKYFEKYPGRFKSWHVKDMDEQGRFAAVGTGSIDFHSILSKKEQSGMEYYFVEQDMTFDGLQPFEAVKISHKALKEIGFD